MKQELGTDSQSKIERYAPVGPSQFLYKFLPLRGSFSFPWTIRLMPRSGALRAVQGIMENEKELITENYRKSNKYWPE
jgi:hypothetical protein